MKAFSLPIAATLAVAAFGLASPAQAGHADLVAEAEAISQSVAADDARYALAGRCVSLQPQATSNLVAAPAGRRYRAGAILPEQAERFRMQATDLGSYLMLGAGNRLLAAGPAGRVIAAAEPTKSADWELNLSGDGFTLTSRATGKSLLMQPNGELATASTAEALAAGDRARFNFAAAQGCLPFPEAELNVVGAPQTGPTSYGEVHGLIDTHSHMMGFEAFGGNVHCGRPWSPLGIEVALHDCPDHYPNGSLALVENIGSYGDPTHTHDPVGWPTFVDWPNRESLTHESVYYRWLERTYRSGLRMMVMLAVDNSALCFIAPTKKYPCNDMLAVRREINDTYALQDYIDAQYGGPGKGWFRIVRTPFQARKVINQGKLAVVLGIEVSEPFDCGLRDGVPQCDRAEIDRGLDEFYAKGVRQMELVNKFDNALSGVTYDGGVTGVLVNIGNREATGEFWEMETCTGRPYDNQPTAVRPGSEAATAIGLLVPGGTLPVYPDGPNCNPRGLSDLGNYMLEGMIERKMLFDPDHMSVKARRESMHLIDAADYSGVVSSHSWSDNPTYKRIYKLGGFVAPQQGDTVGWVDTWKERRRLHRESNSRYDFAIGFSDDMNGFAGQPGPRADAAENPLVYPFTSPIDPGVTVDRQVTGERVFDLNEDGVAHFGLFADWVADLQMQGGDKIIDDLDAGPEAYLQVWERAVGIPGPGCVKRRVQIASAGLGRIGIKVNPRKLLQRAGQPERRPERSYRYCVDGVGNGKAEVAAVFTPGARTGLIATSAGSHRIGPVRPGASVSAIPAGAKPLGPGVFVEKTGVRARRFVYGVRKGEVSFVGVTSRAITRNSASIKPYLRLGDLR